jgi:hypothetical protein
LTSPIWTNDQITIRKNSIPQQSTSEKVIPLRNNAETSLSTFEVSPSQNGITTSGIKQASITHNSIVQPSTPQVGIIQTSTSQISPTQDRRLQITTSQIGSFEVTPSQIGSSQIGTTQIGSLEIASLQITPSQFSSFQTGTREPSVKPRGFGEIDSSQIAVDNISIKQINSFESHTSQISFTEEKTPTKNLTQIEIGENTLLDFQKTLNLTPTKIYPTEIAVFKTTAIDCSELEISTSEIDINKFAPQLNFTQIQSSKVSHPSLITSSQLFASNLSHDASPNLLTNIYNTSQTLWKTTNPIDLTFNITKKSFPNSKSKIRLDWYNLIR